MGRIMKKIAGILLAVIILIILMPSASQADDYFPEHYEYAVQLNMLGLFRGTDIGFELERAPTRLEGAVMFVRLLGAEEEALNQDYPHPFNDVPEWGNPYVGYLYKHELTNGISESEFGSYIPIKAISYITFALRALGYSDDSPGADFSWDNAVMFAYQKEFISYQAFHELITKVFRRGNVAEVSYEILSAEYKDSGVSLIERLVADGAVDKTIAGSLGLIQNSGIETGGISIGSSTAETLAFLGIPDALLDSRYGFKWLTYNSESRGYVQVGIENGIVVGILAASYGYEYENSIGIGMSRYALEDAYGSEPLSELRKPLPGSNTIYVYSLDYENSSTYITSEGDYITYYFDSYENDIITAFLIIEETVEERTIHNFPDNSDETFFDSLEIQVFWITNALRVQKGLDRLLWSSAAETAATMHSKDMAVREYFSHVTPEGVTFGTRLNAQGINFISAGENIAYGYGDSIHMVNDWLNSKTGHRETMLGNFHYLGVGIWIDNNGRMFGAQEFWR